MNRRILYVQFSDAAAYPPIEHSTEILAELGWEVVLLGTSAFGEKLRLPPRSQIRLKNLSLARLGCPLGLEYLVFSLRILYWVCFWRPAWVYASDPLALPALWLLRKLNGVRTIYHEHDAPDTQSASSRFMSMVLFCRTILGRDVELCIIPQQERLVEFLRETGRIRPTICVWNCPRVSEIEENISGDQGELIIYYHGSINKARVPVELIIAASRLGGAVRLRIAGYETAGSIGYVKELVELAAKNGAPGLVEFLGTIPFRKDLLHSAAQAHVGLSLMPKSSEDINLRYMVGASNKPFDYMACGLPLLVTELPEWAATFVEPGYARACDPNDTKSLENELRWYLDHPNERRQMGHRCTDKIRQAWNYDAMFANVLVMLESR